MLVRCSDLVDVTSKGRILYGQAHFGEFSPAELDMQKKIEKATKKEIERIADMFITNVDATLRQGDWLVRAEVVGRNVMSPEQIRQVEAGVSRTTRHQVDIHVLSRCELMVTKQRSSSVEDFTKKLMEGKKGSQMQSQALP